MKRTATALLVCLLGWPAVPAPAQEAGPPVTRRKPSRPRPAEPAAADKAATDSRPSAPETGILVFRCDRDCVVMLDGRKVTELQARVQHRHTVSMGEHIVEATTADGKLRWEEIVKPEGKGQKIVNIVFAEVVATAAAAAAVTPPDQFDRAAAGIYAALDDVRVAGAAIGSALKRNFGFHKASNDGLHSATANLKRELDALKLMSPGDEPRKKAATDIDRAAGAADQYSQTMAKALVSAQEKNSSRGEPQDLTAQALAQLPALTWAPDTLQVFAQSAAFRDALPEDLRARITQDPQDLRLGADSLSVSPLLILDVQKGSLAEDLGLKPGDRLLAVAGTELRSLMDFKRAIRGNLGGRFTLSFEREGKRQDREVKVPSRLP
ncbi:MAG: PDZ domain-containing protein [Vicinamibacteria bacterium]|jgi:hypothetical protein|nr:PDZ domain-containing protein [Vicinamibacteria bacterium]